MDAYIVAGFRSAVGKAPRGLFRFTRPDDLAADVIKHLVASVPNLDKERIDDVIVGNAMPEAEKGFNVSREDQDIFGYNSHKKALAAIQAGKFKDEIVPIKVSETFLDEKEKRKVRDYIVDTDEGPRADTSIEALAKLKPVFAQGG